MFIFERAWGLKTIVTLYLLIFGSNVYAQNNAPIQIEKTPAWVAQKELNVPKKVPINDISEGVYYLHVDNQIKVDKAEKTAFYSRFAELVVNQEGLEEVSQITLNYDPSYQKVILNSLLVHRGTQHIDKTKTVKINILQRESGLEEQLYDGRLTANIIVDDIRVGDIIEYSYTRIGSNPVYKDVFSYDRYVQWTIPVHYQRVRILWGKSNPLHTKKLNTDVTIKERDLGRFKEYALVLHDSVPYHTNSQIPNWFHPFGIVYFYEAEKWSKIAAWAVSLYENAIEGGAEIERIAKDIKDRSNTPEEKVTAGLNYVQSNIRYLGIEMGANSHKPSFAKETLAHRYGDCKDKAVLFISILKALGIEANPALVNTKIQNHIAKLPPIIDAFNHVIVKVTLDDKVYWLDPTRAYQIGKLDNIYQPDYGYALVVENKTHALEPMKNNAHASKRVISDYFDLSKGAGKDVTFESRTDYYGYTAEKQRYDITAKGVSSLQKEYLDFYTSYYPNIDPLMNFESVDDPKTGFVTQKEKYLIKNFWKINNEEKEYTGKFYVNSITFELSKPDQLKRNAPYALNHPVEIKHRIKAKLATDNWSFPDENVLIDNKYFLLKMDSKYNQSLRTLNLDFEYRSKSDHVPAHDIENYLAQRSKADDLLEYGIVKYFTAEAADPSDIGGFTVENIMLLIALAYLIAFLYMIVSWRLDAKKQPSFPDARFYPVSLTKLLILSVASFGLYTCYWFYKNNFYKKREEGSSIMPVARGIFYTFWYYPLYVTLSEDSAKRYQENRVLIQPLALLYAVLFFCAGVLVNKDGFAAVSYIALALLLIPLANYINYINSVNPEAYTYHSRWRVRHTVLVVLSLPIFLLTVADEIGIVPSDKVVQGDKLMAYDIQYMQRHSVFPFEEKPLYFYSDAYLLIRDDGNGFTDNYVFSYWKDNGKLNVSKEHFSNISKIDVNYSKERGVNTIIKIVRNDGSNFILYVSPRDALDKVFVKQLRSKWEKSRAVKVGLKK